MKTFFSPEWKKWIVTNLDAGQNPDGIFKILLDDGFDHAAIVKEMGHKPSKPISDLINPFDKPNQTQQSVQTGHQKNHGKAINPKNIFIPNAKVVDSKKIDLRTVEHFLNEDECNKLIQLIKTKLRPSEIADFKTNESFRTSRTCDLGRIDNKFITEIDERICKLIGIDSMYGEVIQGQYYEVGQEFKAHTDYFEINEYDLHCSVLGQRTYTIMIYLNEVEQGGETRFAKVGCEFKPMTGTAVIWNSLNADGSPNVNTLHQAKPVINGHKAIITKWFRSNKSRY